MNRYEIIVSFSTCAATSGDGGSLMIKPTNVRTDGQTTGVNVVHMRGGWRPNHLASIHDVKRAQVLHDDTEHQEAVHVEEEVKGGSGGIGKIAGVEAAKGEAAGGTSQAEKRAAEDKRWAKRDGVRQREEAEMVGRCRLTQVNPRLTALGVSA